MKKKYLIFYSVDENKEVLKNTQMFRTELKKNKRNKWRCIIMGKIT